LAILNDPSAPSCSARPSGGRRSRSRQVSMGDADYNDCVSTWLSTRSCGPTARSSTCRAPCTCPRGELDEMGVAIRASCGRHWHLAHRAFHLRRKISDETPIDSSCRIDLGATLRWPASSRARWRRSQVPDCSRTPQTVGRCPRVGAVIRPSTAGSSDYRGGALDPFLGVLHG
jgi:hypothetical protein